MGNLSITLGSSFYSSGGDTINQKTWPTAPTGDNVSPGTGTDTGGTGGTGGSSYDQATIDAITYFNNVLTQGYNDASVQANYPQYFSTSSSNQTFWGTSDPTSQSSSYQTYMKTVSYTGVTSIDINNVTGLDQPWKDAAATNSITGYTPSSDSEEIWHSDNMYGLNPGYEMPKDYMNSDYTFLPAIYLTEDLVLFLKSEPYNSMFWQSTVPNPDFSVNNMNNVINNLTNVTGFGQGSDPYIALNPSLTVAQLLKDFAYLYDTYQGTGTLPSGGSYSSSEAIEDDGSGNGYYLFSLGLARVTSVT